MRRRNRLRECVPEESITSDNYLVQLLREEEVIEAIWMVDPEKASEMSRKLQEDLQEPWTYLNKFNKIPAEERLKCFQELKKETEEAQTTEETEVVECKALVKYSPPRKHRPGRISVKNPHISRPPNHNGEYTWSGRVFHIKQEPKWAAKDKAIAAEKPYHNLSRHRTFITPETQFYNHNMRKNKEALWKVPEELVHRPFDAVRAFGDDMRERPLRAAAKKIAIVVTQH